MSINVTLPSNTNKDIYDNTQSRFRIRLAQPLMLHGPWEVGLSEVHIPCTWHTVTATNSKFTVFTRMGELNHTNQGPVCTFSLTYHSIPYKYYESPKEIVAAIGRILENLKCGIHIKYSVLTKRVEIHLQNDSSGISFSEGLGETLGFTSKSLMSHQPPYAGPDAPQFFCYTRIAPTSFHAEYDVDLSGGISAAYIYTDMIEHQYIGDRLAPVLRVVPLSRTNPTVLYYAYDKPYYMAVNKPRIETIEIELRTDFGEHMVFESGKVLVRLHFRAISQ